MGWGMKECSNVIDHMTNMAAMPRYGKNLKNLLLWNQKSNDLRTGMQHRVFKYYQVCSNDDPGLTLTFLPPCKIWSIMLFYGNKLKQ